MNEIIELVIEKPAAGGRMLARHEGRIVLVGGAIPGERVRAKIDREQPGLAYASLVEVLEAHADRRPVHGNAACGGRTYAHIAYERQLLLKADILRDALRRIAKIASLPAVPIAPSRSDGYRMRARLQVRGGRVGFFLEGTHVLCSAAATGQLLPATGEFLERLERVMGAAAARVTTIDLTENIAASERALHLEVAVDPARATSELVGLERLDGVDGFTVGAAGSAKVVARGRPFVSDELGVLLPSVASRREVLRRHAASFFQGNRFLVPQVVARVVEEVPAGSVVDLYAGVGLFGVCLAAAGRAPVTAVESHPQSAADLTVNARPFASALGVRRADVESFLRTAREVPQTVVVDPPRPGLSRDAAAALGRWGAPQIVYVSCDPATLARDIRRLASGGYQLRSLEGFDLFPDTPHIEAMAVLDKARFG